MRKFLLIIILLAFSFSGFAQKQGTPDYLLVKNGFSIFKLGDTIANYIKYIKINPYYNGGSQTYELIDPELVPSEAGIKLTDVKLSVNRGLIERIDVLVPKEHKHILLAILKNHYGASSGTGSAFWKTKNSKVTLAYVNESNSTGMGRAIFVHTALYEDSGILE